MAVGWDSGPMMSTDKFAELPGLSIAVSFCSSLVAETLFESFQFRSRHWPGPSPAPSLLLKPTPDPKEWAQPGPGIPWAVR
eukprot:750433-Hanusia_phi.AAC.1